MPTRYLVLRTDVPVYEPFTFGGPSTRSVTRSGPTELSIETYDGRESDAGDLRADPKNAAVMDAEAQLELIAPLAKSVIDDAAPQFAQISSVRMPAGLPAVGAHTTLYTGLGVTVAILDTGIDESHPAFLGLHLEKRDFTGDAGQDPLDVRDVDGHGTHCAATICGRPVDGIRVGVAPGVAKLCVAKVLGQRGSTLEMLVKGMLWSVMDHGASVVSMSLGYDLAGNTKRLVSQGMDIGLAANAAMRQQSDIIKGISTLRTFLESQQPNVVFIAATGNESSRPQYVLDAGLPAAELFSVGAVGAVDGGWDIASFSNGRAQVVAPGVDVVSAAQGGGWATMSGTSMATPHVAGVAALWTEKIRDEGAISVSDSVRSALTANASRSALVSQSAGIVGAGMVQAPQV